MNSDTLVRWNTAKEIPKKLPAVPVKDSPPPARQVTARPKHDVRFNLPEIKFSHDDGGLGWTPATTDLANVANQSESEIDESYLVPGRTYGERAESIATNILNRELERSGTVLRMKKQARQEKRALKESGDYLGVQGINPKTGQLDIETPTESEESRPSLDMLLQPKEPGSTAGSFHDDLLEKEDKKRLLRVLHQEIHRMDKSKKQAQEDWNNQPVWRRKTQEWSNVMDPADDSSGAPSDAGADVPKRHNSTPRTAKEKFTADLAAKLIHFGDSVHRVPNHSEDSDDAAGYKNGASDGTVVHTPRKRSLAGVSHAAQELFSNGISFDLPGQSNEPGQDRSSRRISSAAVSPTAVSPTSRLAHEGESRESPKSRRNPFLEHSSNKSVDPGEASTSSRRGKSIRAFQDLTNSLRAKTSLGSLVEGTNSETQDPNAKWKQIFRKDKFGLTKAPPTVDAWIADVAQQAERSRSMKTEHCVIQTKNHSENIVLSEVMTERNKENHQEAATMKDAEATSKAPAATKRGYGSRQESAYIPTTITTGYPPEPFTERTSRPKTYKYTDMMTEKQQEQSTTFCPEKKSKTLPKADNIAGVTQSATTSATAQDRRQAANGRMLKVTSNAARARVREANAKMIYPVGQNPAKTIKTACVDNGEKNGLATTVPRHLDKDDYPRMPGAWPQSPAEDGDIAHLFTESESTGAALKRAAATIGTIFNGTLGQLIGALELYCKAVWPVFDPYSAFWDRHARKETTVVDMVVLVLALPGVMMGIQVGIRGFKLALAMISWLRDVVEWFGLWELCGL